MRIGIDCRTILNHEKEKGAGLGHYTYQLVRYLLKIDKDNDYFLFFDKTVKERRLKKITQQNVRFVFFPFIYYTNFIPDKYADYLLSAFFDRYRLDVLHSPTLNLPQFYKGKAIVTAHDVGVLKFPEFYPDKERSNLRKSILRAVKLAKRIIAVSQATKKDLENLLDVESEKIKVIYQGLDERFFKKTNPEIIEKVKKKFKIKDDYILYLGTLEPRKNILRIIEAFERLKEKILKIKDLKIQLVLAGAPGFSFKDIYERINLSKYKEDIILPGYIDPDDLDPLFEGARIFIFPSFYEGFGLPVIEAMAKGVPVIASNIEAIYEIVKDNAILVDPLNIAEISRAMFDLLTNNELWKKFSFLGKERAKDFDWFKTARETLALYQEVKHI
jgi:glycosyltransferase involved in cell wall biosynthesis